MVLSTARPITMQATRLVAGDSAIPPKPSAPKYSRIGRMFGISATSPALGEVNITDRPI